MASVKCIQLFLKNIWKKDHLENLGVDEGKFVPDREKFRAVAKKVTKILCSITGRTFFH